MSFKKGDIVVRIAGDHSGMQVGDIATVKKDVEDGIYSSVYLVEKFGRGTAPGHSQINLRLVTKEESLNYHIKQIKKEIYENTINYSNMAFNLPKR